MDVSLAKFVRWIDPGEPLSEIINDTKALTWEYAVLEISVRGGRLGIKFVAEAGEPYDSFGEPTVRLFMDVQDERVQVIRIVFHTHPMATGPSDWDLKVLGMLGQRESRIYEINGPRDGTRIRPKRGA